MITPRNLAQRWVGCFPECFRKREGFEAIGRGIPESRFECAAVFSRPNFVECGLDDRVNVPAVRCQDEYSIGKNQIRWSSGKVKILCCSGDNETSVKVSNRCVKLRPWPDEQPPLLLGP